MIYILKVLFSIILMIFIVAGLKSFMPKIKIDMDFIGMAICFIMIIVLYCLYS